MTGCTQQQLILKTLKSGKSLTRQSAAQLGVFELSSRIGELESAGHNIKHTWIRRNGKRLMKYTYLSGERKRA